MKLKELTGVLDEIAPLSLAEEWDNVGLLAGDPDQTIKRILLTIDLTAAVLAEARAGKTDLILAYHPPIFSPIKKIVAGKGTSPLLYETVRAGIAVYAFHTALDVVKGGINDLLADIVGIQDAAPLQPAKTQTGKLCKLVVYLPEGDLEKVSHAIFTAGVGHIGNYRKCSFRTGGTGTFQGDAETSPTIGKPNQFTETPELRLETILPVEILGQVAAAMLDAHSYEEVAYDVFPILSAPAGTGIGRVGNLKTPISVPHLVERIKKSLKIKTAGLIGPPRGQVKRAAVGAGSCGSLLQQVIVQECDFYLTGELKHHFALELAHAGVTTLCVGHWHSERPILAPLAKNLRSRCPNLHIKTSSKDRDPFTWR